MNEFILSATGCLMLGIMTPLNPCPMATNIAVISFLSGIPGSRRRKILVLVFFSLGYVFALLGLALLLNYSLVSIPRLSIFLQSILSAFLGPMLILLGMVLSRMIRLSPWFEGFLPGKKFWENKPPIYILLLGILLAITFCPTTAFIFFGLMIPLSVNHGQIILYPILYAFGVLIPIVTIGILINVGFLVALREKWIEKIPVVAGWIMILSGIYITLEQLYF